MQTEKEQQDLIKDYNLSHEQQWNETSDYKDDKFNSKKDSWFRGELDTRKKSAESGYPYQDLKNPIDGGSKVEWAYYNTTLYPLRMHDKLTNKDYFTKKGVPEEYFPKKYYASKKRNYMEKIHELYDNNGIDSMIIKPSMRAESKGIIKIDNINPYTKPKNSGLNLCAFREQNKHLVEMIKDINSDRMSWNIKLGDIRTPFKGTHDDYVIYEENLNPGHKGFLDDYKFWCVNGEPIFCEVISGRENKRINVAFIDENKQRLPLNHTKQKNMSNNELENVLSKCNDEAFKKMMEVAKIASKGLPLIRIDFCLDSKGNPRFIEAQDLYNYNTHQITMDDVNFVVRNGCIVKEIKKNSNNIAIMARKFHLDPRSFEEDKCKIYNNETGTYEQISPFEKMIGNLVDLTKIDEKDIGDYPCGSQKEAEQKELEAKQYLRKIKSINNGLNKIKKFAVKHNMKEIKGFNLNYQNKFKTK